MVNDNWSLGKGAGKKNGKVWSLAKPVHNVPVVN